MGQKVNPHGLRVGVIKDWDSHWYAREALRLAQHKLPIKTRIITKEVETEIGGE